MALSVRRTPRAQSDLDEIWLAIALDNERAAERVVAEIEAAEDRIAAFPEIGRARNELLPGVRSWAVGVYVLFYAIAPAAVVILRIVHGARDVGELIGDA